MASRSQPISFRLPAAYASQLAQRAADRGDKLSVHVERLVTDALNDTHHEELREELAELRKLIEAIRDDFATAIVALLSQKAPYSREEAEAWVRKTFFH